LTDCHCSLQTNSDRQETWRKPYCGRETARCCCKIRYVSKFTAVSRGPCDSTA